jgi:hypothetical protein
VAVAVGAAVGIGRSDEVGSDDAVAVGLGAIDAGAGGRSPLPLVGGAGPALQPARASEIASARRIAARER